MSQANPYFSDRQEPLAALPYPVYFVTKDPAWQDFIAAPDFSDLDALYAKCVEVGEIWSVQVYLDLKQRGLDVHLVSKPVPGEICVIPYRYLRAKDQLFKSYVVACQYDSAHPKLCNQRIVINKLRVIDHNHHFLPHRPQPLLIPRDLARGTKVENLVFKGQECSLSPRFRTPDVLAALADLNVKLVTTTEQSTTRLFDGWRNYADADVVLAVRNLTVFDSSLKPALKLINAWFAGCPAILGPEPAYQDLRQSELDYIQVRSPEEMVAALKRLKTDRDLYIAMVENGFRRAKDYTPDRIAKHWRDLLAVPIAEGYQQWLHQSVWQHQIVRPVQYVGQVLSQQYTAKQHQRKILSGPRIMWQGEN